jgi:hypothetical protein
MLRLMGRFVICRLGQIIKIAFNIAKVPYAVLTCYYRILYCQGGWFELTILAPV